MFLPLHLRQSCWRIFDRHRSVVKLHPFIVWGAKMSIADAHFPIDSSDFNKVSLYTNEASFGTHLEPSAGVGGGGGGCGGASAAVAKGEEPAVGSAVSEGGAPDD